MEIDSLQGKCHYNQWMNVQSVVHYRLAQLCRSSIKINYRNQHTHTDNL